MYQKQYTSTILNMELEEIYIDSNSKVRHILVELQI